MQETPRANRLHIGIFGRRNVGKSTLINALSRQEVAITSSIPGTTTDPVYKAMEIHEIGPVVLIDTGGIDDESELGKMRVSQTYKVLNKTDICLIVIDRETGFSEYEERFLKEIKKRNLPCLVIVNKIDIFKKNGKITEELKKKNLEYIEISALKKINIENVIKKIVELTPDDFERKIILSDLLSPSDLVLIVAPLDIEAPKGRLKLAQVQTIRDILDNSCSTILTKETELENILKNLKQKPKLVITESQVFEKVAKILPEDILLTSFSILYARYKGDLKTLVDGVKQIENLKENDKILISESCTHHPIGDDIGRVIIPNLLLNFKSQISNLKIDYSAGYEFPENLSDYKLIIHCGGCMLTRKEMLNRIDKAKEKNIPITNYGITIAYCYGLLERALKPFRI
jgi:[FeFe] hydrogenase H-cluster maturation GTPase HydF